MNFAMVLGHTAGVRLLMKFEYMPKFIGLLIPLILTMVAFPLVIGYSPEHTAWITANLLIVVIGLIMGTMTSFLGAISGILGP